MYLCVCVVKYQVVFSSLQMLYLNSCFQLIVLLVKLKKIKKLNHYLIIN